VPIALGLTTLLQGLYALLWILVVLDIGSATLTIHSLPEWTGVQLIVGVVGVLAAGSVLGVVMHTLSRNLFRHQKDLWSFRVLTSASTRKRLRAAGISSPSGGAPTVDEIMDPGDEDRVRKAGEFMHALDYVVMLRAPEVFKSIQVYRDQYRIARGFIAPSVAFALVLPWWEPIRLVEGAGRLGPFPVVGLQLSLLAILVACVPFLAFRERAFRYAAARVLSFVTLEGGSGRHAAT